MTRAELGHRLRQARIAAGHSQQGLGTKIGYSRTAVSNAEKGSLEVSRMFWAACDQALGAGGELVAAYDEIRLAERSREWRPPGPGAGPAGELAERAWLRAPSPDLAVAAAAYREMGWQVEVSDGRIDLFTGEQVDALELPLTAGLLAVSLWRYTMGRPDDVRHLPALPDPSRALAVIATGDRCYFLAAPGDQPWAGGRTAAAREPDQGTAGRAGGGPVIRWHGHGGRVPVPPSSLPAGGRAGWAHLPSCRPFLVPPVALLGLLATAAATANSGEPCLTFPGGVVVVPAAAH